MSRSKLVGALSSINHEGYIRAEHKLHSISKSFISQVIIPQVMFFEPIYMPWALSTGTCLRQGNLFYSAGLHRNHVLATTNTGKIGRGFGKNAGEWTGRIEIVRKKSLAVSVACMAIY